MVEKNVVSTNSLGLQVQIDAARAAFPHKGDSWYYRNLGELAMLNTYLLPSSKPVKQEKCLVPPTQPCGCQAQGYV